MKEKLGLLPKKIIQNSDLLIAFLLCYLSEIFTRYFLKIALFVPQALLVDIFIFLFIMAISLLLPDKYRHWFLKIFTITIIIYNFAQSYHYIFFSTVFSFRKLTIVSELINVFREVFEKWDNRFLIYLIPLFIIFFLPEYKGEYKFKKNLIMALILGLLALLLLSGFRSYLYQDYKKDKKWQKDYYLYCVMQNKTAYYNRFGCFSYIIKDIELSIPEAKKILNEEEKNELRSFNNEYSKTIKSAMSGKYKNKNLVMILCESFDESAIAEDLTPTLYELRKDAYYFNNYYSPIFEVATGDAEFISQTGMLPSIDYGTTSYTFHLNHYPNALANLFEDKGYTANSFHSYISNFYNREALHESFGFETFYDMDKLNLKRFNGYTDTYNWQKDADLFKAMLENTDFSKPFYNFVITASGHMPYRQDRQELQDNLKIINSIEKYDDYNDEAKCYLAAQMLLDQGIAELINGLKENNVLDDTIIILFGDHYPYGLKNKTAIETLLGDTDSYEVYRVPFMIYDATNKGEEIATLTSTFDLYPTICDLFSLDNQEYYHIGKDAFKDSGDSFVFFLDRSILTDNYYASGRDHKIISFDGQDHEEEYEKLSSKIERIFKDGQDILLSDYYGLKEDEK